MTEQAVVEDANAPAEPGVAVETRTEQDADLDALLAEFDQKTQPAAPPPEPKVEKPNDFVSQRVQRIEQRLLQEDIDEAVKEVFGDLKVPKRAAIGWLDQAARENEAIQKAFLNKANDPRTWNRFAKALSKEAQKDFAPIDVGATVDREAVTAAVKGASKPIAAEPAPNLGAMNDAEFAAYTRKNFGF